jgi:hypothetical protein
MLLSSLIQNQQSIYTDIQIQIDSLQEKQREIQAFLQKLGSVESQMLSATQMVQEAIASIREVCPDELANYRETIDSLFGDAPIASLNSSSDFEPQIHEHTPPVEPQQPSNQTVDIEVKAEVVTEPKPDEIGLSMIKINGVKERQEAVEKILKVYFPRVKTQDDVKNYGVPTTEKQVKVFLRNKIEDVTKPSTFTGDSEAWQTELFMQATKMETTGKEFWIAVNIILKWLETV